MAQYLIEIQDTIERPINIVKHTVGDLRKYYTCQKNRKYLEKFLRLIVKYFNGHGFIITAQFVRDLK